MFDAGTQFHVLSGRPRQSIQCCAPCTHVSQHQATIGAASALHCHHSLLSFLRAYGMHEAASCATLRCTWWSCFGSMYVVAMPCLQLDICCKRLDCCRRCSWLNEQRCARTAVSTVGTLIWHIIASLLAAQKLLRFSCPHLHGHGRST